MSTLSSARKTLAAPPAGIYRDIRVRIAQHAAGMKYQHAFEPVLFLDLLRQVFAVRKGKRVVQNCNVIPLRSRVCMNLLRSGSCDHRVTGALEIADCDCMNGVSPREHNSSVGSFLFRSANIFFVVPAF